MDVRAVTPTNVYDEQKMKYLLQSSKILGFDVEAIGIGKPFTFSAKIVWLLEYLSSSSDAGHDDIICFTDAYDVFYLEDLETIKRKFVSFGTDIVFSVEKLYSHQLETDKPFYDEMSSGHSYRYMNTGSYIGYKSKMLELFKDIYASMSNPEFLKELGKENYTIQSDSVDQTIVSHHVAKYWSKYNIRFDYTCVLFYNTAGDWWNIDSAIDSNMRLVSTGEVPSTIHVTLKCNFEHILCKLFYQKYASLEGKSYTWQNSSITFLKHGKMDAFGSGSYAFTGKNSVKATFGDKVHMLTFYKDLRGFKSIRESDGDIVHGVSLN
jgi:hypothetical protein